MFVRLGSFAVKPGSLAALRATYYGDCAPLVRASPGNVDCFLLEHATESDRVVACTMWQTEDDAARYEASGTAKEVVDRVREHFAGPPSLSSYHVRRTER